jgi:uncharacterized protein (TIGR02996 family)
MDKLTEHEAFLRAIFDAPGDDTPRLVYADFLEESGESERAAFIRVQCEHARLLALDPGDPGLAGMNDVLKRQVEAQRRLAERCPSAYSRFRCYDRGFPYRKGTLHLHPDDLIDPERLRVKAVAECPHWFGETSLQIERGRLLQADQIDTLFNQPCARQVTDWNLGGHVDEEVGGPQTEDAGTFALIDMNVRPVITVPGVEALAQHRGARRIRTLILTHNNLDNDAARAIVRSPYLINLTRLDLLEGNRLRGKTWQQLLEKFGEHVVG